MVETIGFWLAVFLYLFCASLPVAILVYATVQRWKGAKRRGLNPRFQFFISDLLIASLCWGLTAAVVFEVVPHDDETNVLGYISLALVPAGLLVGKLWHITSEYSQNSIGITHLSIGVLCTLTAAFPLSWLGLMAYMLSRWHGC